jgi:hypothetical protein
MPRFVKGSKEAKDWGAKMRTHKILGKGGGAPVGTTQTQAEEAEIRYNFYKATLERLKHDINEDNAERIANHNTPYITDNLIRYFFTRNISIEDQNRLFDTLDIYHSSETSVNYWNVRRELIRQLNDKFFEEPLLLPNPRHNPNRRVRATPVPHDEYFTTTTVPVVLDNQAGIVIPTEAVTIETVPTAQIIPQGQPTRIVTQEQPAQFITNGGFLNRRLKSRFVKGSIEAKEHMAKLRAMRKK